MDDSWLEMKRMVEEEFGAVKNAVQKRWCDGKEKFYITIEEIGNSVWVDDEYQALKERLENCGYKVEVFSIYASSFGVDGAKLELVLEVSK